jgi:hypothetical protein
VAYNQDDDFSEGPVVVKRAVYDAAMKHEADVEAAGRGPAFEEAREKVHECHAAGDAAGAARWEEIFKFLMWRESVAAGTETIILEEGETYDYENEEIIRAGTNQPRNDMENG